MSIFEMSAETLSVVATRYVRGIAACQTKAELRVLKNVNQDLYHTAIGLRAVALAVTKNQDLCDRVTEEMPKKYFKKLGLLHDFLNAKELISSSASYQALAKESKTYQEDVSKYKTREAFMALYNKAILDNVVALKILTQCYLGEEFMGMQNDYDAAIYCFERAVLLGDVDVCGQFGFYFLQSTDLKKRAKEVELYLLDAIIKHDLNARFYLGCCYLNSELANAEKALSGFQHYILGLKLLKTPISLDVLHRLVFIEKTLPCFQSERSSNILSSIRSYVLED